MKQLQRDYSIDGHVGTSRPSDLNALAVLISFHMDDPATHTPPFL